MMLTRFASLALVAAAAFVPAAPAAAAGTCSGTYDTNCYTWVCDRNCFEVHCGVYTNVVAGYQGGCIG